MSVTPTPDSLGFLLTDTARLIRSAFEHRIAEAGLGITPGEARALSHVASHDGLRQTAIAERMGVEPMTVCTYLDRLEKIGLASRTPDPKDRRAKNVHVTEAATAMIAAIRAETSVLYDEVQHGLDTDERTALIAALKLLRANLTGSGERAGVRHAPAEAMPA